MFSYFIYEIAEGIKTYRGTNIDRKLSVLYLEGNYQNPGDS